MPRKRTIHVERGDTGETYCGHWVEYLQKFMKRSVVFSWYDITVYGYRDSEMCQNCRRCSEVNEDLPLKWEY